MEQSNTFFSLAIDPVTKTNLNATARWARFLAILGMIMLFIAAVAVIFAIFLMSGMGGKIGVETNSPVSFTGPIGIGVGAFYILLLLIWFFPLLYLLRFANRMLFALARNDQQALNNSFLHLKTCFRFVGIVTIIVLILYALVILYIIFGTNTFPAVS
jgi:predicted lysophospholipase L1 biosynthesis ABC-type transport system permease subunit